MLIEVDAVTAIAEALDDVRRGTLRLLAPLDDDIVHRQYDPIMSPLVWDLGHVGSYEELWLLRRLGESEFVDPQRDRVYDAFENPRWTRADLPVLTRADAVAFLEDVRAAVLRRLGTCGIDPDEPLLAGGFVYEMVAQHEAQHQETMLQALDLATATPPYPPAIPRRRHPARRVEDTERVHVPAGVFLMGSTDRAGTYDNERPRHGVHVPGFMLDRFPVTARRYAGFVDSGGYDQPEWWSERGWAWRQETGHDAPQGWVRGRDSSWSIRRFSHVFPLDQAEPVEHVSFFEAEAFARWAGGRLPTEAEWEKAAAWDPSTQRSRRYPWGQRPPTPAHANLGRFRFGPAPIGSFPAGSSAYGVEQLLGDTYEWTSSQFNAYPDFTMFPYPEYSAVFFGGDYRVLRGASWATLPSVARCTFRNWDHPYRRQLFAGFRLAWDA